MSTDEAPVQSGSTGRPRFFIFRNWLSLIGLVVFIGSVFAFILLMALDLLAPQSNPYIGILAYLVIPGVSAVGIFLVVVGLIASRIVARRRGGAPPPLVLDLSLPHAKRNITIFISLTLLFFVFAAVASYRSYHFSESSHFCGEACHVPMKPEFVTYERSPHANIACAECHIGPGASWFVKAKISGLHQVIAVMRDSFERPIKTPVANLRPAQDTCENCHWPKKFSGNLDRIYSHHLMDETNTPYDVRLSLKVGGSDPRQGPVGGIHWHMNVANKIEYIATDPQRQVIPWVRMTDRQGVVREYGTPGFTPDPTNHVIRTMDCMDCHNRPSHIFQTPGESVDKALYTKELDPSIPRIKKIAVDVLTRDYATESEALQAIATTLYDEYEADPRREQITDVIQEIYRVNFFPEMKTSWKTHPDNLGHKTWPGCFRCHDGEHKTSDGKRAIKANDCNACHIILAQGSGDALHQLNPEGYDFEHPGGDIGDLKCHECHSSSHP